ncbi:MAG: hypothetical protein BroJett033_3550 [Chloroflexota bacterium]|nr:MAG: hypothetical protein BroJett033_3550 [Chloroflexota bacterium]
MRAGPWQRLVRFGFRLLYNELAFTYDTVSYVVSLGAWRCWQRAALKHLDVPTAGPVLELAHGTGDLQLDLHALGYSAVGVDLSPYMGRIAQRKLRCHGVPARLVRARAQRLPFAAGTFAAVVCTFPTEFIFAPETLREVARVLRAGGRLVIVPVGLFAERGAVEAGLEWAYRLTGQRGGGPEDVSQLFARCGFTAVLTQEDCPRSRAQVIVARKMA